MSEHVAPKNESNVSIGYELPAERWNKAAETL